ncbi:MAG TPA: hypothetical protein DCE41_28950 [Cytophagales bacterium]|nr:hypothetical protein [Cytophagales bacterium]
MIVLTLQVFTILFLSTTLGINRKIERYANGRVKSEGITLYGMKFLLHTEYYPSGLVETKKYWVADIPHGPHATWDSEGRLLNLEEYYFGDRVLEEDAE